jgi:L-cysteine/cystine lyase
MGLFSPIVDAAAFRAEFPVLGERAYLNAGTDGPLPARAVRAATDELERELAEGRTATHFERRAALNDGLRAAYATALGAAPEDVSLTTSTTEGMAHVIVGLSLKPGDEILTSDEEHPGLQGALIAAREINGVTIREVPFARIAEEVSPATALVACSHVSWATGSVAPLELRDVKVPVLLDGAQGLGAVALDMAELGCDAYAGAGQKWMCGSDGLGALWVDPGLRERLAVPRRGYGNLADANQGLAATLHPDGRRFDVASMSAEAAACGLASAELLQAAGWADVQLRARTLAAQLAEMLTERGRPPEPRGATTLVSFPSEDPEGERAMLAEQGVIVRDIPKRPLLRASVGAWNDEHDLQRLVGTLRP